MHFVGNHRATIGGETATGLTYCLAHHFYQRDGVGRDTLMVIRYLDEYQRSDAGWVFSERVLTIDWQEDRPVQLS